MLATDSRFFKDKLGVIDLGTNSCHLIVAGVLANDEISVLDCDKIPLRLGQHLDDDGYLTDEAITQTIDTIARMQEICNGHGARIKAVATHAVRSAKNQHLLISRVQQSCGVLIEPIDGFEEARLIFLGMRFGLSLGEQCLGVDIGGGSTEIIFATGGTIQSVISLKLGAVTMTRRFFSSTMPTSAEIDELQKFIASQLSTAEPVNYTTAIVSSGTGKALATIDHFLRTGQMLTDVNAYLLPQANLQTIVAEMCQLRASEKIRARFAIDKTRAEIILAGSLILLQIAQNYQVEQWTISSCCLREGIVLDTFDINTDHHLTRWQSIVAFGDKYRIDRQHAQRVNSFSLKLLTKLQPRLLPTIDNRQAEELLAAAAYLHEIGKSIAYAKYHKHSAYLILHGQLLGFNQREKEIIARIARHHRKATPPTIEHLSMIDNRTIEVLTTILRIAVAVLRSRPDHDFEVKIDQTDTVLHFTFGYPDEKGLELFSLHHEQPAIEKMLGSAVTFTLTSQLCD